MALDNGSWGYTRIQGALKNVGHQAGRSTIRRILAKNGIEPGARAKKRDAVEDLPEDTLGWTGSHDFFSVGALTSVGLIQYLVLFAIERVVSRSAEFGIDPPVRGCSRSEGI